MQMLKDSLTYAIRGDGKVVLCLLAGLYFISQFVAVFTPVIGGLASMLVIFYVAATYCYLIETSSSGEHDRPDFPPAEYISGEIWRPLILMLAVGLISSAPLLVYDYWVSESEQSKVVIWLLTALSQIYFPMAMLAVVIRGEHLSSISPHFIIPSIFRAGWLYWVGVLALVALSVIVSFVSDMLEAKAAVLPLLLTMLVGSLIGAYFLMTNARILGVIFREKQEQLNWF